MINRDAWLTALKEASEQDSNPDALTATEIGDLYGKSKSATLILIRKMLADGKMQFVKKRITDSTGRGQVVSAYRLVKP